VNQLTVQRSSRVSCVLGAAILLLAAFPGKAADLVDVRIGLHEKFTRVVLETDARAPCWIESSGSEELVLRLNAGSGARVIASKYSPQLVSVAVMPAGVGVSEIRIALRGPVETEKLVLSTPDRIVLDLRDAGEAGAAPPTAGQPALPTPVPEPVAEAIPEAPLALKPDSLTEVPLERVPAQLLEPALEEVEESEEVLAVPAHPEPDPSAVLAAEEAEEPVPAAPESSTLTPRAVVPPPAAAESGLLDGLPAPFDQPLLLAGLLVALIFVIAFVVLRRRGSAEDEEPNTPFAAGEPFSVDEQPGVAAPQESAEEALPSSPAGATQESSRFDQPVETVERSGEQQSAAPATDPGEVAVAIPAAPPAASADPSQELERRLTQLEERLDEMVDAKDRLGRQIAAQTEELRVQRAAIARTQRVLRDLTRPGDEATEPIPKP
jgi:phosphate uptake regulator